MKSKFVLILGGWIVAFCLILSGVSYGSGIELKINGNSILTNQSGSGFAPTYTGPASASSANIEFFYGGAPASPLSTSGRDDTFVYTLLGGPIYQYDDTVTTTGIQIRSWSGAPRTQGNHYGFSSIYPASSGAVPPQHNDVTTFTTDYLAGPVVNAPSFTGGTESNQRQGYTNNVLLALSVSWSYSVGTAPNKIIATGYTLKYWLDPETEPGDTDVNRVVNVGSGSWSLPATDPKTSLPFGGGTYHFKVRAYNDFVPAGPWSTQFDWTTLSGGGGGPETKTYVFTREANGLGVNTLAIPYKTFQTPAVTSPTLNDLVTYVNSKETSNIVYSIGWWNPSIQQPEGFEIKYNSTNLNDYTATGTSGLGPLTLTSIEKDRAYQMYVIKNTTFSITGSRN